MKVMVGVVRVSVNRVLIRCGVMLFFGDGFGFGVGCDGGVDWCVVGDVWECR